MDQKSDLIREDIDATKEQLTQKLGELENQLRGTVENARETVQDTIEDVKSNLRRFTPTYQIEKRPLVLLGGAVATGFWAGRLLQGSEVAATSVAAAPHFPASALRDYATTSREQVATSEYEDVQPAIDMSYTRQHQRPSFWDKFTETFSDEIDMVKSMAIGAVLGTVRDIAKRSFPDIGANIDEVMGSAMRKFGAEPEPEPRAESEVREEWRRSPSSQS